MWARFVPFLVIATVLLAGCDASAPAAPRSPIATVPITSTPGTSTGSSGRTPSGPTSPAATTPTVPADVPTTGPNLLRRGEKPPVMPVEATQHTEAGAVAFAKFFIQTIDWGFATTSGAYMRHYFENSCIECRSHADSLDLTRNAGEHYIGGRFYIRSASAVSSSGGSSRAAMIRFDITSMEVLDQYGKFVNADIAQHDVGARLTLVWRSGQWIVTDSEPA